MGRKARITFFHKQWIKANNIEIYIAVGGQGTGNCVTEVCKGGYNGGGTSGISTNDDKNFTCSGGGATHIATYNRGELYNYASSIDEIIMVAGGGSGYIGNTILTNKTMYCYNCTTSTEESTKTQSTANVSNNPISTHAKIGNGHAQITFIERIYE